MTNRTNLLVGLTSSLWIALLGFLVVPIYLKYLGVEAYGLIGFFATLQAVLSVLDMGMAATINREVARDSVSGGFKEAGKLLHTLAVIYWVMAGGIALLIVLFSSLIAEHWLQSKLLTSETISHAIVLMGLVIAYRWPVGLYQGALIGANKVAVSSSINAVMGTLGSFGAIVVLVYVSASVESFFIWQVLVGLISVVVMRKAAWSVLGRVDQMKFEIAKLKDVWVFSVGVAGVTVSAIIFTQLDKLILSKTLGLEGFAHYMLAISLVSVLYLLVTPIYNIIYPKFSAFVAAGDLEGLVRFYRSGTRLFAVVFFPLVMALVFVAEDIVVLWIGDPLIAASIAPVVRLLAIGVGFHGVMFFPYALQLAYGDTRLPLTINIILIIILVPTTIFLSLEYGALGGGGAWLVLHALYILLGSWLTHRKLLKGIGIKWFFYDVATPFCLTVCVGLIGFYLMQGRDYSPEINLLCGIVVAMVASCLSLLILTREDRKFIAYQMSWKY
jgi:O-antigen/teichoic acid export membrane protein